jgi:hypothetical protein
MSKALLPAIILSLLVLSCAPSGITSYDSGVREMREIQDKYGVDFEKSPSSAAIPSLKAELLQLERKVVPNEDTMALSLLVEYRTELLEADRLLSEGFKWGAASTTDPGFGCIKGSGRILNSSTLRASSSQHGLAAVDSLQRLIDEHPEEAHALNLSQRTVISLRTNYVIVGQQAQKDRDIVMGFCFKDQAKNAEDQDTDTAP